MMEIVGVIVVVLMVIGLFGVLAERRMHYCPLCRTAVPADATVCSSCGREMTPISHKELHKTEEKPVRVFGVTLYDPKDRG
jgi:hypothetical protein